MKYKTLFRLALKAMGVWLFATGVTALLSHLSWLIMMVLEASASVVGIRFGLTAAVNLLQVGFGLYLFFGGEWIVNRAIPSNRPYCHECGYDLTGATTNRCPECDTPFSPADVRPPQESS